jgi:hypothetical protein
MTGANNSLSFEIWHLVWHSKKGEDFFNQNIPGINTMEADRKC